MSEFLVRCYAAGEMNAHGGFGTWAWDVALQPADVPEVLERRAEG